MEKPTEDFEMAVLQLCIEAAQRVVWVGGDYYLCTDIQETSRIEERGFWLVGYKITKYLPLISNPLNKKTEQREVHSVVESIRSTEPKLRFVFSKHFPFVIFESAR